MRRIVVAVVVVVTALVGCSDDGSETGDGTTSSSASASSGSTTTEPDPLVTMGPNCTVGTIPEAREVPPGCERLYSPFLGPGADCIVGQSPDCIDPDHDGRFTHVLGGGRCLVERKDYDRCRDDDGDGLLDEPLSG